MATALVSTTLDDGSLDLTEIALLVPDKLERLQRGLEFLGANDGHAFVSAYGGFWDVPIATGEPTWVSAPNEDGGGSTRAFFFGDLDSDADEDLVSLHTGYDRGSPVPYLLAWERLSDGALQQRGRFGSTFWGDETPPFLVADADEDGALDIVMYLGSPTVFRGDGAFEFTETEAGPSARYGDLLGLGLFDATGDGVLDLAAAFWPSDGGDENFVNFHAATAAGEFGAADESEIGFKTGAPGAFGEVTGDGAPDYVYWSDIGNSRTGLYVSKGIPAAKPPAVATGGFRAARKVYEADGLNQRPWLVDIDGDGVREILGFGGPDVRVARAVGDGTFDVRVHSVPVGDIQDIAPATGSDLYLLVNIGCRKPCGDGCEGGGFLGMCAECTSDLDCPGSRCVPDPDGPGLFLRCEPCANCDDAGSIDANL